jgi:putative inorganic carbon (HCO3(-)) transporter
MHFGLESYVSYALYLGAVAALQLSVFWRPKVGIYFLLPLIPLQTVRYRMNDLPLGSSLFGVMLLGVAVGLWRERQTLPPAARCFRVLGIYAGFTFGSLCLGSAYLGTSLPLPGDVRFADWREYMIMPAMCLLTAAAIRTKREIQIVILILCLGTFLLDKSFWGTVADREFSTYSEDLHADSGAMGYAGTNGLAAFTAEVSVFLLALAAFEKKIWLRIACYGLAIYSALCLMYSLSRGGYAAFLAGAAVIGLLKQRKILLLLCLFLLTWTTLVPPAVRQRVEMTYDQQSGELDHSSETRLSLWNNALEVFDANLALGAGFNTYEYMHLNQRTDGGTGYYADTHNYFVKMLVETGVIGLLLFLWLLITLLNQGYRLFRRAQDPLFSALGLGLVGWVACAVVANLFGDRWSFLQVNGYMWVIAGLVCRAHALEQTASAATPEGSHPAIATTGFDDEACGESQPELAREALESLFADPVSRERREP